MWERTCLTLQKKEELLLGAIEFFIEYQMKSYFKIQLTKVFRMYAILTISNKSKKKNYKQKLN
jgi:hypothetical protein